MGKFVSIGEVNKSLLFILYMSVSNVFNSYIYGFTYIECFYPMNIYKSLYQGIIDENKEDFPRHRVFDPFFSYIGIIFISLIFVNEKRVNDKEKKSQIILYENINRLYTKFINERKKSYLKNWRGLFYYVLIIMLWIIEENLLLIYVDIFQDLDFWFFELIFVSFIFSKFFSTKILSHQKLGMAISIIVGSSLKIYSIGLSLNSGTFYSKNKFLIFFVIFYFLLIILRSYVNTEVKIFLDLKYISLRTLLISYGIAGAILCLIAGIFTSNVTCYEILRNYVCKIEYDGKLYYDEYHNYYESGKNMLVRLIVIFLGIISFFFEKYFYTLIIKFYTPIHVILSFPIQFFIEKTFLLIFTAIFFIKDLFSKENQLQKFLMDESGDIVSIIGFLIYLEILELNFCNLNYNLKKNIIKRGENETEDIGKLLEKMFRLSSELFEIELQENDKTMIC